MFSLLQANWTYTGYDASAHVAEETVGARIASAWGIFLSVAVSAVFGFIFLFALATHLPDLSTLFPTELDGLVDVQHRTTSARAYAVIRHPEVQPRHGRRPARRGHRHRHVVLWPLIDRLGRPHALRLQP